VLLLERLRQKRPQVLVNHEEYHPLRARVLEHDGRKCQRLRLLNQFARAERFRYLTIDDETVLSGLVSVALYQRPTHCRQKYQLCRAANGWLADASRNQK
jgi:hypothetical protein